MKNLKRPAALQWLAALTGSFSMNSSMEPEKERRAELWQHLGTKTTAHGMCNSATPIGAVSGSRN